MGKIGVVDYGVGTWLSVLNMLDSLGVESDLVRSPEAIDEVSHLVLPGVGNFGHAAKQLEEQGWLEAVGAAAVSGKPVLGICLGMQLLGDVSEEASGTGLSLIPFRSTRLSENGPYRVPHMGWNSVEPSSQHPIFSRWSTEFRFYFVHSFGVPASASGSIGLTKLNEPFTSVVAHENVVGVQFHPEKSRKFGAQVLLNFIEM